ncbi:MAG: ATP-binding cassette domain-containing protein, partial [Sediminibacterium sp.]|uniref:ATP-binding cassette domain-containing protein n=1 Tax=Sediminibacterium sp. TaxID=1917865 RepID=UPI002727C545
MPDILEVDSLAKRYSERVILSDVYLKCITGDIVGLFGRNGTGKSTLMKIVFGMEKADNKFVRVNDKVLLSQSQLMQEISYLSQDTFLPNNLTVLEIIRLTLNNQNVDSFLNDAVLSPFLNTKVNSLSGGELRYLEIKLLLNLPSKFALLDEPFNGLSPIIVQAVSELIKSHSKSKGIILTDHDYHSVLDIANRFYLLSDG